MIRVLQFAGTINRYDFIDNIVRFANPQDFYVGVCVRSGRTNIADPGYGPDIPQWISYGRTRKDIPAESVRLARILREWQPHILHVHHFDEAVVGLLATRLAPQAQLVIGRHYSDSIYRSSRALKQRTLLTLEWLCNSAAARIVVPSSYIHEILTRWQRVNPAKVDVVPYGFVPAKYSTLDLKEVRRIRDEFCPEGGILIGNFGRLHEEKGQRYLLEAMRKLKRRNQTAILLVVGEGPERDALEEQISALGLGDVVRLLGWRRDAMSLMAAVDIVVQPTLQEGFSQVMVEALWMRKPLVITEVSGAPDVVSDGENGLLVPKADVGALAGAIERVIDNPRLRALLAQNGRAYVERNLQMERIITRYEDVYRHALNPATRSAQTASA